MNDTLAIFLLTDEARAIQVVYDPDKEHEKSLCKTLNPDVAVDDYVIVRTGTRHHMTVAKVVEVDIEPDFDSSAAVQWIVGRVDLVDFSQLEDQEKLALAKIKSAEKRKRRQELRDALIADAGDELKALPIYSETKNKP